MGEGKYDVRIEQGNGLAVGDGAMVINHPEKVIVNPPATSKQASTTDAYLKALIRYCDEHPYISLPGSRRERPPLSTLYVRRRVRQQEGEPPEAKEPAPRRQPTVEAMRAHPSLVLLGEPGAGKSTWAYHTARQVAQGKGEAVGVAEPYLPLLVRLGLVAARGEGDFVKHLKATLEAELSLTLPDDFFTAWPQQAKRKGWLLICDGLDEVRDERMRLNFVRHLEQLAEAGHRLLITSRPSGYERTAPRFPTFELEPFTPEEAETFLRHWFGAFLAPEETEAQVRGLLEMTHRRHLTGLLANPLLTTVIAVVYHERETLAARRPALYREFIEVMLREAKERGMQAALAEESGLTGTQAGDLIALTHDLLARVALAMQQRGGTEEEALAEALVPFLQEEMGKGQRTVYNYAIAWLRIVGQRSGVLVQRGRRYEFLHPTFREYLAARALAEEYGSDPAALWEVLEPHLLEEDWAEVIPLTLAHLEEATPLVERLLEANAEDEDQQRLLFRAAMALADGADVAEAVKRRVIDGLAHLVRTRGWLEGASRASASKALAALGRMEGEGYAAEVLLTLARDKTIYTPVRITVAKALSKVGSIQEASKILLALAQDRREAGWIRLSAAEALGRCGCIKEANEVLITIAQNKEIWERERERAAEFLGKLGYTNKAAALLLTLSRDKTVGRPTHERAIQALREMGQESSLLNLARDGKVAMWVRLSAAEALGKLGRVGEAAPILLAIAQNGAVDAGWRVWAAEALGELGRIEEAISILRAIAQDGTVDAKKGVQAAEALGRLGRVEEAVSLLLAIAQDGTVDAEKRVQAAEALGRLGCVEEATQAWLAIAQDGTVDTGDRVGAAEALAELGGVAEAIPILFAIARDEKVWAWTRVRAAEALGKIGRAEESTLILLAVAQDGAVDAWTRVEAAEALGKLGLVEEAIPILLDIAQDRAVDAGLRVWTAQALGALGRAEESVSLLRAIARDTSVERRIRDRAVGILRRLGYAL